MGRFSAWLEDHAPQKPAASIDEEEPAPQGPALEAFLVDNSLLRSGSSGIKYRRSPDLEDRDERVKPARFGSIVRGEVCGDWLKVGRRYLPMHLNGAPVLVLERVAASSDDQRRPDAEIDPVAELLKEKLWGEPAHDQAVASRSRPATVVEPAAQLPPACRGWPHEVMWDRVVIRAAPAVRATTLDVRTKGEEIELFEWDETREWRRCPADNQGTYGWALLDHHEYGALLRPKGLPFSAKPMEPVCVAAFEDNVHQLRRFIAEGLDIHVRDPGGNTPLMLAAQAGAMQSCVLLLDAGATLGSSADKAANVLAAALPGPTYALLSALFGGGTDVALLEEALGQLSEDIREIAEDILDRAAAAVAAAAAAAATRVASQQARQERAKRELEERLAAEAAAEQERSRERESYEGFDMRRPKAAAKPGGVLYEVVHKSVWIRYLPSTNAEPVSTRIKGSIVTLYEYDKSRKWRRFDDPLSGEEGWMLLSHPEIGPLLLPLDNEEG